MFIHYKFYLTISMNQYYHVLLIIINHTITFIMFEINQILFLIMVT